MIKKYYWFYVPFLLAWTVLPSCNGDDQVIDETPKEITEYNNEGFFIINQGPFTTGNSSISFYHRGYGLAAHNIFSEANNGELPGKGIQSMKIINGLLYIVSGYSNKIIIVNPSNMVKEGEITGFQLPKDIVQINPNKAYVSQWGNDEVSGSIQIIDLNSNTIIDSIETRPGPEEMVKIGINLYVANSGGANLDSVLTKINVLNDEILTTINVGLAPSYLEVDKDLNLWVMTRGAIIDPSDPTVNIKGRLAKVNNDEVTLSLLIKPASNGLTINRTQDILYYVQNGWVYEHPIVNTSISLIPYIERSFYGLEIDPISNNLIGMDAKDFNLDGALFIYDDDKTLLDTVEVGIAPIGGIFQ